jgi:ribonuclease HII
MFIKNLSLIIESNIKQYKDEKQLEIARREELLQEISNKKTVEELYEFNEKLAKNEYSAERNFISRLKEALTGYFYKVIERFKKIL